MPVGLQKLMGTEVSCNVHTGSAYELTTLLEHVHGVYVRFQPGYRP